MNDAFEFRSGQDCEIFKADAFVPGDEVIYIPDTDLNDIPLDEPIADDEAIEDVLDCCYTGNDFLAEVEGDADAAVRLFWFCDWQHPSSVVDEGVLFDDEETEE